MLVLLTWKEDASIRSQLRLWILFLHSHGNADAERGFSITKQHLELHGNNTDEDTLNVLWNVKDYLLQNRGSENFEETIDLKTQKSSCAIWIYKAEKEKMECKLLEDASTKKQEFENQDKFAEIERDIGGTSKQYKDGWKDH